MRALLLLGLLAVGAASGCSDPGSTAADASFGGVWLDGQGALVLWRSKEGVEGWFLSTSGVGHAVRGRAREGTLAFTYGSPGASGEGRLTLDAGGEETTGTLTPEAGTPRPWRGILLHRDAGASGQALIDALQLEDPPRRRAAAGALGLLGTEARAAVPALVELLGDTDPAAADAAELALARIGPPGAPDLFKLMCGLKSPSARVRAGAADALGLLGREAQAALDLLDASMEDVAPKVRRAVIRARQRIRSGSGDATSPR